MSFDARAATRRQHVRPFLSNVRVRSKVWLEVEGTFAIGEGGIELLNAIAADGSLADAARRVGWSYRHAWGYVRRAEKVLGTALVATTSGKGSARGMRLTTAGERLTEWFVAVRSDDSTPGKLN